MFATFAASQLRPVFFHANELRTKFELPILGMVSAVSRDADGRRQRTDRLRFASALGGLVLLFFAGSAAVSFLANR
jgi:hypothetical protein